MLIKKIVKNYYGERRKNNNDYYRMINRTESADSFLLSLTKKAHLYIFIY